MDLKEKLPILLADTYAIYLKTQNYHWHVKGPLFKTLHELFEEQYRELATAVDNIAERLLMLNQKAPATFKEFDHLKTLSDGDSNYTANEMLTELASDHQKLINDLNEAIVLAQNNKDEGSISLLSERILVHEKARWMLLASSEQY